MRSICWYFSFILTIASVALHAADPHAAYGAKVRFLKGRAIQFPDFILIFTGTRQTPPVGNRAGWLVYEFTVRDAKGERPVAWSAGMGDIAPSRFTAGGRGYLLELLQSDTVGRLKEGELVVRTAP